MARLSGGGVLLLVGVVGGFVPILQGWIFILAGLTLMAPESRRAHLALDWLKEKLHIHRHHHHEGGGERQSTRREERARHAGHDSGSQR